MSESYAKQLSKKQILELRSILSDLPPYVKDFMRSIETTTQPRTRIGYAHDIKYFFEFLQSEYTPPVWLKPFKFLRADPAVAGPT